MPSNKNICQCPVPPGGRASCEARQLAICRILEGQSIAECISPPPYIRRESDVFPRPPYDPYPPYEDYAYRAIAATQRVSNWVLTSVGKEKRAALNPITEYQVNFLRRGLNLEGREQSELRDGYLRTVRYRPSGRLARAIESWIYFVEREASPLRKMDDGWTIRETPANRYELAYDYEGPEYFEPDSGNDEDT